MDGEPDWGQWLKQKGAKIEKPETCAITGIQLISVQAAIIKSQGPDVWLFGRVLERWRGVVCNIIFD